MTLRARDAAGQQVLLQAKHYIAVFGVNQRQRAEPGAALEGVVELIVVDHERALVGHEMLEGVDAVSLYDRLHLLPDLLRPAGDRHVKGIVGRGLLGLVAPVLVGRQHRLARCGDAHVDNHGRAAGECGPGSRVEVVSRHGAHEQQLHVGVRVDAAGHYIAAARVDDVAGSGRLKLLAHRDNPAAFDEHVGAARVVVVYDGAAANERGHVSVLKRISLTAWSLRVARRVRDGFGCRQIRGRPV